MSELQPRREVLSSLQDKERGALRLLNTCTEGYNPIPLHKAVNIWGLTWFWKARAGPSKEGWKARRAWKIYDPGLPQKLWEEVRC